MINALNFETTNISATMMVESLSSLPTNFSYPDTDYLDFLINPTKFGLSVMHVLLQVASFAHCMLLSGVTKTIQTTILSCTNEGVTLFSEVIRETIS